MRRGVIGGIYVVKVAKDAVTEYWAAATVRENAVASVEKEVGLGWTVTLTDRCLANQRLSILKMLPNTVRKL
jgi:hypothetical protein